MAANLKWHGDKAEAEALAEFRRRLAACALTVAGHAKRLVGIEGAARSKKGTSRDAKGRFLKGSGKLKYGANPSEPGEPPHKQTGTLQRSITWEWAGPLSVRVGTNLKYGRWLELGTKLIAARPWLRRALAEMRGRILALLNKPMSRG